MKSDFNLLDAFRMFDTDSKGYATSFDLQSGAEKLQMYPSKEELYLFMMRYDRDHDGRIK